VAAAITFTLWPARDQMLGLIALPVSQLLPQSLALLTKAMIAGPDWLSGGATGPEGGVLCTVSLLGLVYGVNALWPKPKQAA
jgi:hypothetical protein